jgi:hypothetical protein
MKLIKVVKQVNPETFSPEVFLTIQTSIEALTDVWVLGEEAYSILGTEFANLLREYKNEINRTT